VAVTLDIRNESQYKRLYRRAALAALAERVCAGEGLKGGCELSVVFCDDPFIHALNRQYRKKDAPTDVLAFPQDRLPGRTVQPLGDIVISLETAARRCHGDRSAMRREMELLFCHGLLHLLGYDHATAAQESRMTRKQAQYLKAPPASHAAHRHGGQANRA
jgi:probable rRNA maturation factor